MTNQPVNLKTQRRGCPALLEGGVTKTHLQFTRYNRIDTTIQNLTIAKAETKHKWLRRLIQAKLVEAQARFVIQTEEDYYAAR
jgi:hypothetical protein